MDDARRTQLERDAGGDYDEENAVCYLQIVLANEIAGSDSQQMCSDMDAWGYTFRLGSARAWFERDAADARQLAAWRTGSSTTARPAYRNLSVALISSCVLPGSNAEWPASGTMRRSASGQARCSSHAVCIGHTTS